MTTLIESTMLGLEVVKRLKRDLALAATTLTDREARFLVDAYYGMQEDRKRSSNQERALGDTDEPHRVLSWLAEQNATLEGQIKLALDKYSNGHPLGRWARANYGIGPVIAAGLLAHIDLTVARSAGAIWRLAGLDPTVRWEKGEKRPWNASLKTLCWKIGQSFMKFSAQDECFYGHIYRARKALEVERNERGDFADQAAAMLTAKRFGDATEARKHYLAGKLPPAQLDARARRYAVKFFLSHYFEVGYRLTHDGQPAPQPYVIGHLHHVDYVPPFIPWDAVG